MGGTDPFATLGLGPDATSEEIRTARRRLAKVNHPTRAVTRSSCSASTKQLTLRCSPSTWKSPWSATLGSCRGRPVSSSGCPDAGVSGHLSGMARDMPSFTVEALPVETFEAMLVVASWLGEVLDDDPPIGSRRTCTSRSTAGVASTWSPTRERRRSASPSPASTAHRRPTSSWSERLGQRSERARLADVTIGV